MKSKILRNDLEMCISNCYDACERKASESITKLKFNSNKLIVSCKGAFTFYQQEMVPTSVDSDCEFYLKTSTILEFVKHVGCEELILAYDENKKVCMVSTVDKKSKIAFQTLNLEMLEETENSFEVSFEIQNPHEFVHKLINASKFCSLYDYPLTGIHCKVNESTFEIKATNGPAFYGTSIKKAETAEEEFYLPKKAPSILKNIFSGSTLKTLSINSKCALFESNNCKLKIYLEKSEKNSFPNQIIEWANKSPEAKVKVSNFELSKTLKFFNGIFSDDRAKFNINDSLVLESSTNKSNTDVKNEIAAKETIAVEHCSGVAQSMYSIKFFLESLEALQSAWIELDFINMKEDYFICKITNDETLVLLCPAI
jgi:hypothetical protein